MLVDKPLHMVTQHFKDAWGQEWFEGDYVIRDLWYEKLRQGNRSYYFLEDSPPTFVYSHLIVASKFPTPRTTHVVRGSLSIDELSTKVLRFIHKGLTFDN